MIEYSTTKIISAVEFADLLHRSTLGQRRPVDQPERLARMLANADILITAWDGALLVGISRAITDYAYCCYLSDLAVDTAYQKQGIGKQLIALTHEQAGMECALILLAAPAAMDYYEKIGLGKIANGFMIPRRA